MSPILVTFTSNSDSNFERSNISFKENKLDGVDLNSNSFFCCVRKKEGRTLRFSADSDSVTSPYFEYQEERDRQFLQLLTVTSVLLFAAASKQAQLCCVPQSPHSVQQCLILEFD